MDATLLSHRYHFTHQHRPSGGDAIGFILPLADEAVTTSAIEGAELNPQSVRSSVAKQLGLPFFGPPPSDRYIDGLVEVLLDATTHYSKPLTAERLKGWQAALFPTGFSGIHAVRVGKWRNLPMQVMSGPVGREKVHYEAPLHAKLEREMAALRGPSLIWRLPRMKN